MLMCQQSGNELASQQQIFSTNQVLQEEKGNKIIYYLPAYLRFKVKELLSLDIEGLQGEVSGTLLFSFYYGNLSQDILDQFVGETEKGILLQFRRQDSLLLKEDKDITFKEDLKNKQVDFVVRQNFTCNLVGDVFYTPFEVINLYLTMTIQSVNLNPKDNGGKKIVIKFNCMKSEDITVMVNHSQSIHLGNYNLANYFLSAKYTNSDKTPFKKISAWDREDDQDEDVSKRGPKIRPQRQQSLNQTKDLMNIHREGGELVSATKLNKEDDAIIKNYQYAHFRIPLYQFPISNLINIFLPLWVLGFINLLIFFQNIDLSGRLAVISTLTLAFIAFVPTINEKIPQTPYIKLVQILIYMLTLTTIFCMIDSLVITQTEDPNTYAFDWRSDGWFIVALIINLLSFFIVVLMFVIHKCYWEKAYTGVRVTNKKKNPMKLWRNKKCDDQFGSFFTAGRLKMI